MRKAALEIEPIVLVATGGVVYWLFNNQRSAFVAVAIGLGGCALVGVSCWLLGRWRDWHESEALQEFGAVLPTGAWLTYAVVIIALSGLLGAVIAASGADDKTATGIAVIAGGIAVKAAEKLAGWFAAFRPEAMGKRWMTKRYEGRFPAMSSGSYVAADGYRAVWLDEAMFAEPDARTVEGWGLGAREERLKRIGAALSRAG